MKLHRIALQNLNSLYDDHAVDLDSDLDGASLFLIQGPTGAGKSTLMDAVSLALFGTTPRLSRAGHDRATTGEAVASQIMSRGTGEATASVEFSTWREGQRVRFRATWTAWRANKRPGGKLQKPARSLERQTQDGDWMLVVSSQKRKDHEPAFADALDGFGPEDFQRSMLLAQGNFDAMLRASPTERATILERLTDTSEYAAIGRRAAEVHSAWSRRLSSIESRRTAISPTPPEELAAAHTAQDEAKAALVRLRTRSEQLRRTVQWLQQDAELQSRESAAAAALAAVHKDHERHDEELAALAEHERCAPALQARTEQLRIGAECTLTSAQVAQVEATLPAREGALARARATLGALQSRFTASEQALAQLREPAQRAAQAQDTVRQAQNEQVAARARQARTERHRTEAAGALDAARAAREAAAAAEAQARASLQARSADQPLHAARDELTEQARSLRDDAARLSRDRSALDEAQKTHGHNSTALAKRRESRAAREEQRLQPLLAARDAARSRVLALVAEGPAETALAEARARREALLERHSSLKEALEAARSCDEARAVRDEAASAAKLAQDALNQAVAARSAAEAATTATTETVRQAEAVLAPLQRISALAAERAELAPEEPCPLCGSKDHPFHSDPAVQASFDQVGAELTGAQAALKAAQDELRRREQALASARLTEATRRERSEAAVLRRDKTAQRWETRHQALLAALTAAELPPLESTAAVQAPRVHEAVEACRREGTAARSRITALEAAAAAQSTAESQLREAQESLRDEARALETATARLDQQSAELKRRADDLKCRSDDLAKARAAHAARLSALGVSAPTEAPETALPIVHQRAKAWAEARDALQLATPRHLAAQEAEATAQDALKQATLNHTEAVEAASARDNALATAQAAAQAAATTLHSAWRQCQEVGLVDASAPLPAAPLPHVEAALAEQRTALDAQRTTAEAAATALTEARARLRTLAAALARLQSALHDANTQVETHRQALGLASVEALDAARLDDETLRQRRSLKQQLRERLTQANSRVAALRDQRRAHAADRPQGIEDGATIDILKASQAELAVERDQLQERLDTAGATLRMAAEKAEELAKIEQELDRVRRDAAVWLHLHELIGKADGRHFKEFAQALNLDQLLARANAHLSRLSPRYRLQTVRDPDTGLPTLDFCIRDQWRPGTTRPVRTLSGGESFLVSLAMALGLSDLRTSRMPVETLLLDEGFGTLDPQTLDVALSALQQLQSSGRQVGIISHVVGLQESIPARILVEPVGDGRSRVRACTA